MAFENLLSQVEKLSKPATEKVMDLNTAIKKFVTDGCYLCWGGFADRASIASVFEIARQGIKDLVITTETDTFMQTSVLMGLGLVKKYEFAYDTKIQLAHRHFKQLDHQMCHTLS